ncbi:MAG: peptidylprolyl isomerase [Candidatus Delongbacteria bacterium]|nr:peptidylprolyl isomerase [Candidatus Delongbacteria bacterium]
MRFFKAVIIAIVILTLIACKQNSNNSKMIATSSVGNILFSDFEDQMLLREFEGDKLKAANSKIEQRVRFLNSMLMDDIIKDQAIENKLDNIEAVKTAFHNKLYYDAIVNHLIVDSVRSKVFGESEVKATYEKKKINYFPKHILIASSNKRNLKQSKLRIDSVYNELMAGADFSELAVRYSDDKKTGVNGGDLGWLHSYELLEEFENEMLKLNKGEISKPFTTKFGYHIVFLSDKTKNKDIKSFEEEKSIIAQELTQKYGQKYSMENQKFLDKLIPRLNVQVDTSNIKVFIKQYSKNEKEFEASDKDPILNFSKSDRKKILINFNDVALDIDTLLTMLGKVNIEKRPPLKSLNNVIVILKNILKIEMLEEYADQLGYTKKPELIKKAKGTLIPVYRETLVNMIKSKIEVSDAEIEEFYKKNKEKYKTPEGYDPIDKVKAMIRNSVKARKFNNEVKNWEKELYEKYKVSIDKVLLEESFYYVTDDKK